MYVIFYRTNRVEEQDSNIDIGTRDHKNSVLKMESKEQVRSVEKRNIPFQLSLRIYGIQSQ